MKTNVARKIHTHEGGIAKQVNPEQQLRRSVMSCLLWEKEFYESGEDIAKRISFLVGQVSPDVVSEIAVEARSKMKLRHCPLWIAVSMLEHPAHKTHVAKLLPRIIQRADELSEFLALYWKGGSRKQNGKLKMAHQVRKGLAKAFCNFSEYELVKYNRDGAVKLRDVLFLSHAKPKDEDQAALWKRLINGELATPDTWEVALSSGGDKQAHWLRLLAEKKLGAMALLRNLRNMQEAAVPVADIRKALSNIKTERVLPFRFIAAARHAPSLEPELEAAMFKCVVEQSRIDGETILLVDVSGSMDYQLSGKSDLTRLDAACGLGMLLREVCENVRIFTFSNNLVEVPPRRGFALRDAIVGSQPHGGTQLGGALRLLGTSTRDRIIVITDEQSSDSVPDPIGTGWMINVASARNGVGYGAWRHIDGWSEAVVDYMRVSEEKTMS